MGLSGPELKKHYEEDQYILEWKDISDLPSLIFYPENIKLKILNFFK